MARSTDPPDDPDTSNPDTSNPTLTVLGEVLDLLAGIEARQKVLAREISHLRAVAEDRSQEDVLDELRTLFEKNLTQERDRILSRVSLLSNLPPEAPPTDPGANEDAPRDGSED
jgi:hypothetical protein